MRVKEDLPKAKKPFPATGKQYTAWDTKKKNSLDTSENKSHQEKKTTKDPKCSRSPKANQETLNCRDEYMESCRVNGGWITSDEDKEASDNHNADIISSKIDQSGEATDDMQQKPTKEIKQDEFTKSFITSTKSDITNESLLPLATGENISRSIYDKGFRSRAKSNCLQPEDEKENADGVQTKCGEQKKPVEESSGCKTIVQQGKDIGSSRRNSEVARHKVGTVRKMIQRPKTCKSTIIKQSRSRSTTGLAKEPTSQKTANKMPRRRLCQSDKRVEETPKQAEKINSSGRAKDAVEKNCNASLSEKKENEKKEIEMKTAESRGLLSHSQSTKGAASSEQFFKFTLRGKRCLGSVKKFSSKPNNMEGVIQSNMQDKINVHTNQAAATDTDFDICNERNKTPLDEGPGSVLDQRQARIRSPSPILLPSKSQIQSFHKVAVREMHKKIDTLARRRSYRAPLGFQSKLSADR